MQIYYFEINFENKRREICSLFRFINVNNASEAKSELFDIATGIEKEYTIQHPSSPVHIPDNPTYIKKLQQMHQKLQSDLDFLYVHDWRFSRELIEREKLQNVSIYGILYPNPNRKPIAKGIEYIFPITVANRSDPNIEYMKIELGQPY